MKNKNILLLISILLIIIISNYIFKNIESNKQNITDNKKAELLLDEFGFNINLGCETIIKQDYNETFKSLVAIIKTKEKHIKEEKCSKYYKEKIKDNIYKGELSYCIHSTSTISYKDVNETYKKLYNKDIPKKSVNGINLNDYFYEMYKYDKINEMFIKEVPYKTTTECKTKNIRKIKHIEETKNIIKINFYDYLFKQNKINNNTYHFETELFETDILCKKDEECINIIKSKYIDKLDEYQVTFELINNNYIFKDIKQIFN